LLATSQQCHNMQPVRTHTHHMCKIALILRWSQTRSAPLESRRLHLPLASTRPARWTCRVQQAK
jgi:hypothetical protein